MSNRDAAVDPAGVLAHVRSSGLLPADGPLLVMLSGGRDSLCLLDVAVCLLEAGDVRALHVDYGLRARAAGDQRLCREVCHELGVPLEVVEAGSPRRGNLQAWAREVRYRAARSLAARDGALIAVAHTASDQAETVLYRLAASPGRRALLGMSESEGDILRPLLGVTREQTTAHCRGRGLAWRDDESNVSGRYARARVRGGLLDAMRAVHPAAEENVVRTARLLREEADVLDAVVAEVLEGRRSVALARLRSLPASLRRLVCRTLAEQEAAELVPAAAARADEIIELGASPGSSALDLGRGVRAIVEYGELRFSAGPRPEAVEPVMLPVPGRVRFGDCLVSSGTGQPEARAGVLAGESVRGPLVVRAWRAGDRMAPLGLGGTRSLQDLFTDRRVPRERRHLLPIVESAGEIAWVPGVATGRRFAVTPQTRVGVHLRADQDARAPDR